jgi:hypothetical protein
VSSLEGFVSFSSFSSNSSVDVDARRFFSLQIRLVEALELRVVLDFKLSSLLTVSSSSTVVCSLFDSLFKSKLSTSSSQYE